MFLVTLPNNSYREFNDFEDAKKTAIDQCLNSGEEIKIYLACESVKPEIKVKEFIFWKPKGNVLHANSVGTIMKDNALLTNSVIANIIKPIEDDDDMSPF